MATPAQVRPSPTIACLTDPSASLLWVSLFHPCLSPTHPYSAQLLPRLSCLPALQRKSTTPQEGPRRSGPTYLSPFASLQSLALGCSQGPCWLPSISLAPSLPSTISLLHCLTSFLMLRSLRDRTVSVLFVAESPEQSIL